MDLRKTISLGHELIEQHGLKGWQFNLDRAKRRFGQCRINDKTITISANLATLNEEETVKDTILHEIAHALAGAKHGHDQVWQSIAREIGCDGKRCYGKEVKTPARKYVAICWNCGHEAHRDKLSSRKSSCGICSRTYNEKYKLTFKLNKQN